MEVNNRYKTINIEDEDKSVQSKLSVARGHLRINDNMSSVAASRMSK